MHDVAVGLDLHQLVDRHAAVLADAAEVVAAEVDEHHVLGALLLVGQQLGAIRRSSSGVAPRGRVPAIGLVADVAAGDRQQRLGARAGDLEVAEVQEVHVRARVDRAQAAVDRERLDRHRRRPALGGHDLEGVAGVDVLDDPRHHRFELLARHVRLELAAARSRRGSARGSARGTGPASARAHLGDRPRRPPRRRARRPARPARSALARIVTVCLRWSNTTSASESISAMSGSPSGSGPGSPSGSTVRTRS